MLSISEPHDDPGPVSYDLCSITRFRIRFHCIFEQNKHRDIFEMCSWFLFVKTCDKIIKRNICHY